MNERQKQLMKMAGITRQELAERLGLKQPAVSRLLDPKRDPKLSTLVRISDAMGVDILALIETYEVWSSRPPVIEPDQDPWE
jgi:transcriptional regulator with XRE-family HTH domain